MLKVIDVPAARFTSHVVSDVVKVPTVSSGEAPTWPPGITLNKSKLHIRHLRSSQIMRTDLIITGGAVVDQISRVLSHCITTSLRRRNAVVSLV